MLLEAIAIAAVPLAISTAVEIRGKQLTEFYLMPCGFLIELNFLSPSMKGQIQTTICIKSRNSKAYASASGGKVCCTDKYKKSR